MLKENLEKEREEMHLRRLAILKDKIEKETVY